MRTLKYNDQSGMREYAERVIGVTLRNDAAFIGVGDDDGYSAVFGFDTFSPSNCYMHIAAEHGLLPLGRDYPYILRWVFDYPFNQCGLRRVSSLVTASNKVSYALTSKRGGQLEGIMRGAGENGEDMYLFGMLREECRWLSPKPF